MECAIKIPNLLHLVYDEGTGVLYILHCYILTLLFDLNLCFGTTTCSMVALLFNHFPFFVEATDFANSFLGSGVFFGLCHRA